MYVSEEFAVKICDIVIKQFKTHSNRIDTSNYVHNSGSNHEISDSFQCDYETDEDFVGSEGSK